MHGTYLRRLTTHFVSGLVALGLALVVGGTAFTGLPTLTADPDGSLGAGHDVVPMAVTGNSCSYANAGTGSHARTICWLDFNGFDSNGADVSESVSLSLPGGYALTATLSSVGADGGGSSSNNRYRSRYVRAAGFPTWGGTTGGAFLGNTLNGNSFYTGVAGKPALYQYRENTGSGQDAGHTLAVSTVTLSNIQLKLNGVAVQGYSLVVADAETTDSNESIDWTTTGGNFSVLSNGPGNTMGNACTPTFTNSGSTARCAANNDSFKTGTPMLVTAAPGTGGWSVSQKFTGVGLQGVAFGLMFAKASAEVVIDGRIASADQFTVSMEAAQLGQQAITATTSGSATAGSSALTGEKELVVPVGQSAPVTYAVTGSTTGWANDYTEDWVCTRGGSSIYTGSTAPASSVTSVSVGQLVHCKVTLTPPKLTLQKKVVNDFGGTAVATDWTLSASGPTPISGVNAASGVTSVPVKTGTYTLAENSGPSGYDAAGWVCGTTNAGSGGTGSVAIAKGTATTCAVTNKDRPGSLAIVKAFENVPVGLGGIAFTGTYTCTIPGKASATGTWSVTGAGAATLVATNGSPAYNQLPKGATCSATEVQPIGSGGLANSSWVWDAPATSGSVTIVANQTGTITVTNKPKRAYGNFAVAKVVPQGNNADSANTYKGGWSCTLGSETKSGTWGPIAAGGTWTSSVADQIPLGASCAVTSEDRPEFPVAADHSYAWDGEPVISQAIEAKGAAPLGVVSVTNKTKRAVGSFGVVKAFDSTVPADSGNIAFTGGYTCTLAGTTIASGTWTRTGAGPATLTPAPATPAVNQIPAGASCAATENQPTGSAGLPNSSYEWDAYSAGSAVTIVADQSGTVTVTNKAKRSYGNFAVTKIVPDGSSADSANTYQGNWSCTLGSAPNVETKSGTWGPIKSGETWTSTATNQIPLGASCAVTSEERPQWPIAGDHSQQWDGEPGISQAVEAKRESLNAITVTNPTKPVLGSVTWVKTDGTRVVLSGSEWSIKGPGAAGATLPITDCTAAPCAGPDLDPLPGKFLVTGLAWGNYTISETKAPAGYYPMQGSKTFTIGSDDGVDVALGDIANTRITGPEIPLTGGIGRDFFSITGLSGLVIGLGALAFGQVRNRRKGVAARP